MLTFFLTVFQLLGVIVTAFGVLTRTLKKEHLKGNRARWLCFLSEEWSVRWVLFGLVIGLSSTVIQTWKTNHDQREANRKTAQDALNQSQVLTNVLTEVELQRRSLAYMERIIGRFDQLSVSVAFDCTTNDPVVGDFASDFRALCGPISPKELAAFTGSTGGVFYFYSYAPVQSNSVLLTYFSGPPLVISASLSSLFRAGWLTHSFSDTNFQRLTDCLQKPAIALGLFSREWAKNLSKPPGVVGGDDDGLKIDLNLGARLPISAADFYAVGSEATDPRLSYWPAENRVIVSWQCTVPTNTWRTNSRMTSIPDLADAALVVCLTNFPVRFRSALIPQQITLTFDKATITVSEFIRSGPRLKKLSHPSPPPSLPPPAATATSPRPTNFGIFPPIIFTSLSLPQNEDQGAFVAKLPRYEKLQLASWLVPPPPLPAR
jgi:hypothetical protein